MRSHPAAWRRRRSILIAGGFALFAFSGTVVQAVARMAPREAILDGLATAIVIFAVAGTIGAAPR